MANAPVEQQTIPGYDFGSSRTSTSPVSLEELRDLEQTVGWTDDDARALASLGDLVAERAEEIVDSWRSVIGAHPHLSRWFVGPDGRPDEQYKASVKRRFVQWVRDVFAKPRDRAWLDYQDEIGKRHTPEKKNRTDGARTPDLVPLRYTAAFTAVVITTMRSFVVDRGIPLDQAVRFQDAWTKAVMLHVTLWTRAYARDGLW
jgi:hypothetical protein